MANLREWLEKARQVSPGPLIGGIMPSDRTLRELVTPEPGTVYGDVLPAARLRDDETPPANDRWPFEEIRPAVPGMLRDFARAVKFPYDYAHSDMDPTSPEVVTRATESALALMGGGAFMRAPKDSLRMFAGRNAKTADLGALERAQQMEARGIERDAIWSETGWFKGVDGQWRFEIDDSAAKLVTDKTVPAEKEVWNKFFNGDNGDWHAEMLMSHDDLFKAYPDAKYTPTAKMPPEIWAAGAFDPNTGRIFLQEPAATGVPLKGLFLHELQHGLQRKEGFAPGSIPDAKTKSDYWNSAGEVEARNVQARANMSPEERRATPPWVTQDVPDADQIVRRDRTGPAASYPADAPLRAPELPAATTPAERQAREVLELLRSGRASEVTDDMMAAADPAYLFDHYDLPMDEASRLARAREMGFDTDTPLYHGTTKDFAGFDLKHIGTANDDGFYGKGIYSTPNAALASDYAWDTSPKRAGRVLPLLASGPHMPYNQTSIHSTKVMRDLYGSDFPEMPLSIKDAPDLEKFAKERDYAGVDVKVDAIGQYDVLAPTHERVTFDPANIRSRFARFDPRLSHLRNLNAANAAPEMALLPGAGEALRPELAAAQIDPMEAEIEAYLEAVMRGEAE